MSMAMTQDDFDMRASTLEKAPESDVTEVPKEKKKKKKGRVNIEDMYSFDLAEVEKTLPVKKKKQEADPDQVTKKALTRAMKNLAKIAAKEKTPQTPPGTEETEETEPMIPLSKQVTENIEIDEKKVEEPHQALLRCASPTRTRTESPKKKESPDSPKKRESMSTPMKASAAEFVPPCSSPLKASTAEFVPPELTYSSPAKSLQADAAEFVPPPSLQADAAEFVPPCFEPKTVTKFTEHPCHEPLHIPVPPAAVPVSEPSKESCWAHAVFTPTEALDATKEKPQEMVKVPTLKLDDCKPNPSTIPVPASLVGEGDDAKWSARLSVDSILGKVKQSLTAQLLRLGPDSSSECTKDPSQGKVLEKVRKIEEKEADNEAEKQREAAMKAVNDAQKEEDRFNDAKFRQEMDETLMDCFLQAVTTRVKDRDLPIMGTTLYGKHMRMCRRIGTSCDVKDSNFVWLRPFLESLEDDGLLEIKPEVKDPTVIWINRNHPLIRKWKPWAWTQCVGSQKQGSRR
jgi:hypothetical protein